MAKLKASTLIEVTVAMVLVSIITTIAIFIYLNTVSSITSTKDLILRTKAYSYMNEYVQKREFESLNKQDEEGDLIQITARDHNQLKNVLVVSCTVSDSLQLKEVNVKRLVYELE